MSTFKSIYWHQGLFLKPHHFQYLYAQQQQQNFKLKEFLEPYFWGVSKLSIDKKELLNKTVLIDELELVFMDGTVVCIPDDALVSSRSFEDRYDDMENDLKIYIGIKSFNKNTPNVTEVDSFDNLESIDTRFVTNTESDDVDNLYHKDESAQIQFMDYCLKIFFEDEVKNLNSYQLIPIAKIQKQSEQVVLSDDFVAPLLDVRADSNLFETLKVVQKDLTSHVLQLQEYKLPSNVVLQEPNYLKYVMALQTLSSYVPKLNHMIKTPNIHPVRFYEIFLELIGVLSTFSNRVNVFGKLENGKLLLREYDHMNLYECFNDAKMLIKELLDVIIIGPDYILPFVKNETTFTLDCPVSVFHAKYRYFLVLKTPTDKEMLKSAFSEFAKIAASSEIETIVERSLLGLPFEFYDMPIQGLPQKDESSYYELITDDEQWGHIQQMQNITIEFDEALDDTSMELVVLKN